jgi:uncharacterized protein YqhQ
MTKEAPPRYMGGQAVMEGVMMRGESSWAVAVRKPDGTIDVEVNEAPSWSNRYSKIPFVRGVTGLAESLALGFKALTWSANQQATEEDEPVSKGAMTTTIVIALAFFVGVFILLPAFGARGLADLFHGGNVWTQVLEGVIRIAIFLGYLLLIGRMADIQRVFQYHGAEHKAIAAYENDAPMTPESAQQFSTEHVRCGTNFLLTVMVVTIVVYAFVGRPSLWILVLSRIVLIPVVAGVAYELIRFAAKHMQWRWVRVAMKPGLGLQKLTTREPDLGQLEVAIASLQAVFTAEQKAEVARRVPATVARSFSRPLPAT